VLDFEVTTSQRLALDLDWSVFKRNQRRCFSSEGHLMNDNVSILLAVKLICGVYTCTVYALVQCTVCILVQSVQSVLLYSLYTCTACILVQSVHLYSLYTCTVCTLVQSVHLYSLYTCTVCTGNGIIMQHMLILHIICLVKC
jgi:hypothetical protein